MAWTRAVKRIEFIMNLTDDNAAWSGVAEVVPVAGNSLLEGAQGAFVGVVGLSRSEDEFKELVSSSFQSMGFEVFQLKDVEQISTEKDLERLDLDMRTRAVSLSQSCPFAVGVFHSYRVDGTDS